MRRVVVLLALLVSTATPAHPADDPLRREQWNLEHVRAAGAWQEATGEDVVIAIVDTGVDLRHQDLAANIAAGLDLVDGDATPEDENGHGTHVAGIAAAVAGNGRGVAGVAPDARIMPVRVLDADGEGTSTDVARGIRWAVSHGADVINLSLGDLGQPLFGPAFDDAIQDAWIAGAVVVVASGDEYVLGSGYRDEPAVVVSATDRDEAEPSYSSGVGGARWGIAAPGGEAVLAEPEEQILSTVWREGRRDRYGRLAGTSMAAAHVSGAAALLLSLGLDAQETIDTLLVTARDLGPPGPDATFGAGLVDAAAAVADARAVLAARAAQRAARETLPAAPAAPPAIGAPPSPSPAAPRPSRRGATRERRVALDVPTKPVDSGFPYTDAVAGGVALMAVLSAARRAGRVRAGP